MNQKKLRPVLLLAPLFLLLILCLGSPVTVKASSYVKQTNTKVSIFSKKTGWVKIGSDYYYYNSKGRLLCGSIKYKGNYYYSGTDGRRITGWVIRNGKRYYYHKKTGVMYRSRWVNSSKYRYCFDKNGVALANRWLNYKGKRYYFLSNSAMATGWQKIGSYYYYFNSKGIMSKNTWVGIYYVNSSGRRTSKTRVVTTQNKNSTSYTYNSATLKITLNKKSVHGVSYWVAHIRTTKASQLKSALSYGSYGGTRQTTSSAVSSNKGIIGVNGSAFDYGNGRPSPLGMCIKNGTIYGDYMTSYSVMAVKKDGTMYTPSQGLMGKDLLKAGVKDTYNFGPVLINNGMAQPAWAETSKYYPRCAVGMVKPNDYVLLVTNTGNYSGLNHWDMVSIFQSFG